MAMLQSCNACGGSGLVLDTRAPEPNVKTACPDCCGTGYDLGTAVADRRLPNGEGVPC